MRHLRDKFSLSQNCMIIQCLGNCCDVRFYFYQFQPAFQYHRNLIPEHMQASFRIEDLNGYDAVLPPIDEQRAIANYLDQEMAKLDELSTEAEAAITLLQERRGALISAAVTGKIDVRRLIDGDAPISDAVAA